ncbi:MAG: DUF998 domain-containing protein [Promethearchaeota archaeon]
MKQIYIGFLGILWVLLFSSLTLIALILYEGYDPFMYPISILGTGDDGIFFNAGLIIAGYLGSIMIYERYKNFNTTLTIIGIFAMNSLALIGWFPMTTKQHNVFTFLMFCSMVMFLLLYTILLRSDHSRPYYGVLMMVLYVICGFISVTVTEWIVFITMNIWICVTSINSIIFERKKNEENINL